VTVADDERQLDGLVATVDRQSHGRAGLAAAHVSREPVELGDLHSVDRGDHVTGEQPGCCGR